MKVDDVEFHLTKWKYSVLDFFILQYYILHFISWFSLKWDVITVPYCCVNSQSHRYVCWKAFFTADFRRTLNNIENIFYKNLHNVCAVFQCHCESSLWYEHHQDLKLKLLNVSERCESQSTLHWTLAWFLEIMDSFASKCSQLVADCVCLPLTCTRGLFDLKNSCLPRPKTARQWAKNAL